MRLTYWLLGAGSGFLIGLIIVLILAQTVKITPPKDKPKPPAMMICHDPTGFGPADAPGQ